jgi:hypothetical protein
LHSGFNKNIKMLTLIDDCDDVDKDNDV